MKLNEAELKAAIRKGFSAVAELLEDNGAEIQDGVTVRAGMLVQVDGYKHRQYTVAPKGADPDTRRMTGVLSVFVPTTGAVKFIRLSKGVTFNGQPVTGYAN